MIEIKHRFTGDVLHALRADSLIQAKLAGASLVSADFAGRDLRGANLRGAGLSAADFAGANLSGCNLRDVDLTGTVLTGANLSGVDLRGAKFGGTDLGHSGLEDADLRGVDLHESNLIGSDLSRARLQGANLATASMNYALLIGAVFDDRTRFPALIFDPEKKGAIRAVAGATPEPGDDPELYEAATWDTADPVVECLFHRASDSATLSLHLRLATGWVRVDRPTDALVAQVQQALGSAGSEVRAYRVGSAVGLLFRTRRV